MAWPWIGPNNKVRRISRSSVPCNMSIGSSFCFRISALVDVPLECRPTLVECQRKRARDYRTRQGDFVWLDTKAIDSGDKKSAKPSDQTFPHLKFAEIPHNKARHGVVLSSLCEGTGAGRRKGL